MKTSIFFVRKVVVFATTFFFLMIINYSQAIAVKPSPSVQPTLLPASFDFGVLVAGRDSCAIFTVSNWLLDNIMITGISFSTQNKDFTIKPIFKDPITVVGAGGTFTFSICYKGDLQQLNITDTLIVELNGSPILKSSLSAHTQPLCLETEHALSYKDPIVIGATVNHEFHLLNTTSADMTVTSVMLDNTSAGFAITTPMPILVPAHSSNKVLDYAFSATSDFNGTFFSTTFATINLQGNNLQCTSVSVLLIGNIAKPGGGSGIDTNLRPLFPTEARTLALTGTGQATSEKFIFTNNLNFVVTVNKIYMKDGTFFRISSTDPSPVPFTLSPDQTMTITISDSSLNSNVHTDSLMIETSHNLLTTAFQVQSVQAAPSKVSNELPSDVTISVLPNPAVNYVIVNLAGVRSADMQVFDVLGKQVASGKSITFWKWDASHIFDGTYIVRIYGESLSKEHFVVSKRIIINK